MQLSLYLCEVTTWDTQQSISWKSHTSRTGTSAIKRLQFIHLARQKLKYSGTYIRSLARDLAELLGSKGHLSSLKRTKSGGIDIKNTFKLDSGEGWRSYAVSPEQALDFMPKIEWRGDFSYILNGRPLNLDIDGICALTYNQKIVAIVENTNGKTVYKKNLCNYYKDKF